MKLSVNWLPLDLARTHQVAAAAETAGLWGLGIADSPKYGELYAACATAISATSHLAISTCVTNPVTRHWSVHASAARLLTEGSGGRFRIGMGRGDSAVGSFGLPAATITKMENAIVLIREQAPSTPLLVAASGLATASMASRVADGIIAGVGRDTATLKTIGDAFLNDSRAGSQGKELWATLRIGVGRDHDEVSQLKHDFLPRAISAAHYTFAKTFEGKNVPPLMQEIIRERLAHYDYTTHGKPGATSNARLFSDHPEIESYLVDRFAVIGTPEICLERLQELSPLVDGVYLSLLFEDALTQIDRIGWLAAEL